MPNAMPDARRTVLGALVVVGLVVVAFLGPRENCPQDSEKLYRELAAVRDSVLAYSDGGSLIAATPDGSQRRVLIGMPAEGAHVSPAWSPDGTQIAFIYAPKCNLRRQRSYRITHSHDGLRLVHSGSDGEDGLRSISQAARTEKPTLGYRCPVEGIYIMNADGTEPRLLHADGNLWNGFGLDWSPDGGSLLYTSDGSLCLCCPDDPARPPVQLIQGRGGSFGPDLNKAPGFQGHVAYHHVAHGITVLRLEVPESGSVNVSPHGELFRSAVIDAPSFSPDGRRIAFMRGPRTSMQRDLCVVDVSLGRDGPVEFGEPRCIIRDRPLRGVISWSPDGRYLTVSMADKKTGFGRSIKLYHVDTEGRIAPFHSEDYARMASTPAWSPAQNRRLVNGWTGAPTRHAQLRQ